MTEIFNPGEPLDINALNSISSKLTALEANLAAYTTSQSLENSTQTPFVVKAGATGQDYTPEAGKDLSIPISFGYTFKTSPFVVITPYGLASNKLDTLFYYVGGSYGTSNFNLHYYAMNTWNGGKIGFNWIAVGQPA